MNTQTEIMKKLIYNLILSLIIMVLSGCKQDNSPAQLNFKVYDQNPILTTGEEGIWDEEFAGAPSIIRSDSLFYMFYLGCNKTLSIAVGLAISRDGFHFVKYKANPVLAPDGTGFDAMQAAPGRIVKIDSLWVMFYNGQEQIVYSPGPHIGRATAKHLTGPWRRDDKPVLSGGSRGEWDEGFILPGSILVMDDGTLRMYYTGGADIMRWGDFYIGMATSPDGIVWTKYNDPATTKHPFAESDPVMKPGNKGDWDGSDVWMPHVTKFKDEFRMFYSGTPEYARSEASEISSIGYASSRDGIYWVKSVENPILSSSDDPHFRNPGISGGIENPWVVYSDSAWYLFYDFTNSPSGIGMATAVMK
jgi:predicted GH43/DUF377 family glycosyl hydrolase